MSPVLRRSVRSILILFLLTGSASSQYTISGIVSSARSGEAAINAQVLLFTDSVTADSRPIRTTQTNNFGFYSLPRIPSGNYVLFVRSIGFATYRAPVMADGDVKKDVPLTDDPVLMEEVTIEEHRAAESAGSISRIAVPADILQTAPSFGSEKDVFRVLQLLPGVKATSEISSGLYVRGGSADQNLILLDGVIVYNPFHLGGFLSSFNPDALLGVNILKGAFPAQYGGRLSSVIEMTMKEGTKERFTGTGGIGLIASKLTLQGPITENMTFMVSGRRMYLDILVWLAGESDKAPRYYFYDFNAKLNYRLSSDDRLYLSGYFGGDDLTTPRTPGDPILDIFWGNSTANLRWMHVVDPTLFTNFSLIYTNFRFQTLIESPFPSDPHFSSLSRIRDIVMRGELQYHPAEDHFITAGAEVTHHGFLANAATDIVDLPEQGTTDVRSIEGAAYGQDEWQIAPLWKANVGTRLFYFQSGAYLNLEPRLSLSYALSEASTATISYSEGHQYLHLITRNETLLPTDVWFPSTTNIPPGRAWQSAAGISSTFGEGEYFGSIEAYYKSMRNLYEYKDNAEFVFGTPLETQFTNGTGTAYGAEFFLQKRTGELTGWIGYTLSWAKRHFAELNLGREFFPRYDRRHDISVVINYALGENWQLGATWVYATGQAFTVPEGFFTFPSITGVSSYGGYYYSSSQEYVSRRNNYRAPAYHRLDLNFVHRRTIFGLKSELSINIYNAYSRNNPFYIMVDNDYSSNQSKKVLKQYSLFPILPTAGWSFSF